MGAPPIPTLAVISLIAVSMTSTEPPQCVSKLGDVDQRAVVAQRDIPDRRRDGDLTDHPALGGVDHQQLAAVGVGGADVDEAAVGADPHRVDGAADAVGDVDGLDPAEGVDHGEADDVLSGLADEDPRAVRADRDVRRGACDRVVGDDPLVSVSMTATESY